MSGRPMRALLLVGIAMLAGPIASNAQPATESLLEAAIAGPHRGAGNRARDAFRKPKEVLLFWGLKPDMTVVEMWPDTGWFAEILAPVLRERGRYVAAQYPLQHPTTNDGRRRARLAFEEKVRMFPAVFDRTVITDLAAPDRLAMVAPGTADMVLSIRSVHVWLYRKYDDAMFRAAFDALKPGGILGVSDHRAPEGWSIQRQADSGYVSESYVIRVAERAGFRFVAKSELKANPRDTKDYAKGVWALPPSLANGDADSDKYLAIGESDRMVLKFVKP